MPAKTARVLAVAPMPPEKSAYALARYSRSPDSIRDSIEWVRTHDSAKFLESFYFQYGHASIADLGHVVLCFEGVSELAATEIEDEQLWDGQARSSRYQDFSRSGFVTPPGAGTRRTRPSMQRPRLEAAGGLSPDPQAHGRVSDEKLPRPEEMKPDAYAAQHRRPGVRRGALHFVLRDSDRRRTGDQHPDAGKADPAVEGVRVRGGSGDRGRDGGGVRGSAGLRVGSVGSGEPLAPTLARHVDPDEHAVAVAAGFAGLGPPESPAVVRPAPEAVDLLRSERHARGDRGDVAVSGHRTGRFEDCMKWRERGRRLGANEVIDVALRSRTPQEELLRGFRGGLYAFDIVMDIGAYRDLHRHRRCQQFRQAYSAELGYDTPDGDLRSGPGRGCTNP